MCDCPKYIFTVHFLIVLLKNNSTFSKNNFQLCRSSLGMHGPITYINVRGAEQAIKKSQFNTQ